jgi:hypothetical protein
MQVILYRNVSRISGQYASEVSRAERWVKERGPRGPAGGRMARPVAALGIKKAPPEGGA